jgi:hypothetical protein
MERWEDKPVEWRGRLVTLPSNLHNGLVNYVEIGCPTGHFLQAVIENNLREAVLRADEVSLKLLPWVWAWLHFYTPGQCHGSPKEFKDWIGHFGMVGVRLEQAVDVLARDLFEEAREEGCQKAPGWREPIEEYADRLWADKLQTLALALIAEKGEGDG